MILVHRLRGDAFYLNADLIETIESAPDTIVTLVDGRRLVVSETPPALAERVVRFRASVLVAADGLRDASATPVLRLLPDEDGDG